MSSTSESPIETTGVEPAGEAFPPAPTLVCDTAALIDALPDTAGVLWKLAESGRQLDANVVHLPADTRVGTHSEPDLDVLLLVLAGDGVLGTGTEDTPQKLAAGMLMWLPHGSTRSITAGPGALSYLTVHRRRPGMRIRPAPPRDGQEIGA
jgi:quercetin dioxygenase-like cupin family protein